MNLSPASIIPAAGMAAALAPTLASAQGAAAAPERPNILLIVADDLGYSDLGCYGGEIDTPHLDRLAAEGVRFSNYLVNTMCVVSRTSIMTGHTHFQSANYAHSLPVTRLLSDAGYRNVISGKWHQPGNPLDHGFDDFYGFLGGQIDSWTGMQVGKHQIQDDRTAPSPVPDGWYATDAFTDHAIAEIDRSLDAGAPFFSYVAYNAPHSPLHAPRDVVEKYPDRYMAGWETLRAARYERLRAMGLIDDRYVMIPPGAEVRRWDEMRPEDRNVEAWRMAGYAGMVDRMDTNIGRLLDHLENRGVLDDTLVIFFSDNGGDYGNGDINTYTDHPPWEPGTNPHASNGWGYLKNAPFNWYKHTTAAGVRSPLIVRWPAGLVSEPGSILHHRLHVTDLYPTLLELAGTEYPADDDGRALKPLYGNSMLPLFTNPALPELAIHDEVHWCYPSAASSQRGLLAGEWKIVSINDSPWMLYNVALDPAESRNIAGQHPEIVQSLNDRWYAFTNAETNAPPQLRQPVLDRVQGWGLHRVQLVMNGLTGLTPAQAATDVARNTVLAMEFTQPVSFAGTANKTIRLYKVSDPTTPVWTADPSESSPWEGQRRVEFNELPELEPDTSYFVLTDAGWIKIGGTNAGRLNDGAYWWRFRTAPGAAGIAVR